ncbi:hypothetical protein [Streptomyces sp. NBC_00566]|uniref:hypothetical protein n=1 Tax=Streptomyces sp. NBC_00566 TaxID=2975778 RepID=UPI002E80F66F|nr:hypothetical protein [Streptomyces sp. NBC_00566]WUB85989.1 hypothetical protein OG812_05025 [Streptomyces sp. NBC_00566]
MIKYAGLYRELGDVGDQSTSAPSLRNAAREAGEWDEGRVLAYLDAGHEIFTAMGAERDVIAGDVWITGAGSLITDGTWVWTIELAYYVGRHHVELLPEFLDHVRAQNYVSPEVPHDRALAIFEEHFGANARAAAAADADTEQDVFVWHRPAFTYASAQNLIDRLADSGLSVAHPLTDNVFGFRDTAQGARQPLVGGTGTLLSALAEGGYRTVEFQCWMGYDVSFSVTVRRPDDATQELAFRIADDPGPDREEALAALRRTLDPDPENSGPARSRGSRHG